MSEDLKFYAFALHALAEQAISAMDLSPLRAMGGTVHTEIAQDMMAGPRRYRCTITFNLEPKP